MHSVRRHLDVLLLLRYIRTSHRFDARRRRHQRMVSRRHRRRRRRGRHDGGGGPRVGLRDESVTHGLRIGVGEIERGMLRGRRRGAHHAPAAIRRVRSIDGDLLWMIGVRLGEIFLMVNNLIIGLGLPLETMICLSTIALRS